jgi:hypothetical protein
MIAASRSRAQERSWGTSGAQLCCAAVGLARGSIESPRCFGHREPQGTLLIVITADRGLRKLQSNASRQPGTTTSEGALFAGLIPEESATRRRGFDVFERVGVFQKLSSTGRWSPSARKPFSEHRLCPRVAQFVGDVAADRVERLCLSQTRGRQVGPAIGTSTNPHLGDFHLLPR